MHAPGDVVVVSSGTSEVSIATGTGALSVFEPATGAIVQVNDAWVRLYGYSKEEARTMRVVDVSAEPNATRDAIARATNVGGAQIEIRWHKNRDGVVFPVHLVAGLLRVGERTLMFALMHDITERLRAADSVARSEASFRALVASMPDAVVVHREGRLVFMNAAALEMLGYSAVEEIVGRPAIEIVHPDDREAVIERVRDLVVEHRPAAAREERLLRTDGESVFAEIVAIPTTFDGEPAVLAIARDLTARKRLEAQLVTTDRLASLGRLAASVGHEINNPLSYVLGNVELLRRMLADLGERERASFGEAIGAIETGALRVRDIVRDLKTLSRDDTTPTTVDVNRVVDLSAEMTAHELRHRARLVRDLEPGVIAHAQEGRLGQIIVNLLVNAGESIVGEPRDNEVRITTRATSDSAVIEVRDTGVGIPTEVRDRIFEPFFTTRAPGGGTGLGLSICHHLVTAFGGTIEVEPNVPRGTCFRVTLPARGPSSVAPEAVALPPAPRASAMRARVLVVEDEPLLATVLQHTLDQHDVTIARSYRAAETVLAAERPFDVILCDMLLGDGSGADVDKYLREHQRETAARVVFMTGGANVREVAAFLATTDRPVLQKPFSMDAVVGAVTAVLASTARPPSSPS